MLKRLICVGVLFVLAYDSYAQGGPADPHEGTHFEVAYSWLWTAATETPMPIPFQLFVHSQQDGWVRLEYGPTHSRGRIEYPLVANNTLRITTPPSLGSGAVGTIEQRAFTLTSSTPITVCTSIAYRGGGTTVLHYPVAVWGNDYRTFNYPEDMYGAYGNENHRPGQFMIIAAEDSTSVTFEAPMVLIGRNNSDTFSAHTPHTVVMNAHDVLTLFARVTKAGRSNATDLTGTHITSSKPIAIVSGHTKGAVGELPALIPPKSNFAAPAHFVRNGFTQSVLPNSLADTSFITVPLLYTAIRTDNTLDTDSAHLGGDVVRVLAIYDNTVVQRMGADSTSYLELATLDAGEYYTDYAVRDVSMWSLSKPAHIMQYGKSWATGKPIAGVAPVRSKDEQIQGHATVEAGMPTMLVVPGLARRISHASFYAPDELDNFMNVVIRTSDIPNLVASDTIAFRSIGQSEYSYARMPVRGGTHNLSLEETDEGSRFMAWSYGSLDGLSQGRSYGHPVNLQLPPRCGDAVTIDVSRANTRASVSGAVNSTCSHMHHYDIVSIANVVHDSTMVSTDSIRLFLSHKNQNVAGSVTVRFFASDGQWADSVVVFNANTVGVTEGPPTEKHDNDLHFTIHPQPAHDGLLITFRKGPRRGLNSAFSPRASLCIFDLQGGLMFDLSDQLVGEQGTVSVNTSAFASGMYLLHLSDGMHACTRRIIVE